MDTRAEVPFVFLITLATRSHSPAETRSRTLATPFPKCLIKRLFPTAPGPLQAPPMNSHVYLRYYCAWLPRNHRKSDARELESSGLLSAEAPDPEVAPPLLASLTSHNTLCLR